MRILEITHSFVRHKDDYISRFLLTLFEGLRDSGTEVKVLAPHSRGLAKEEDLNGIVVERFEYASERREILAYKGNMHEIVFSSPSNFILLFDFIIGAFKSIKRNINGYEIVHLHWWIPFGIPLSLLTAGYKKPFIISLHGTDVRLMKKFKPLRYALRWLSKRVNKLVVVSDFIKETIIDYGIDGNKLEVIPMPVEEELFYPEKHFNSVKIILTVARFSGQKRIDRILKVAEKLKEEKVEFHIVGSGERESEIRNMVDDMNLKNVVLIPPMGREEIADKMRKSDIFLLLSEDEGFGMVAVEAMLSGVPVIVTHSGGFVDIVEDGKTGVLVDGDDMEGIADTIKKFLNDSHYRAGMVERARIEAARYSRKNISEKFKELFENVLKG